MLFITFRPKEIRHDIFFDHLATILLFFCIFEGYYFSFSGIFVCLIDWIHVHTYRIGDRPRDDHANL